MNCNIDVPCKMIISNKFQFGFILETVFSYKMYAKVKHSSLKCQKVNWTAIMFDDIVHSYSNFNHL